MAAIAAQVQHEDGLDRPDDGQCSECSGELALSFKHGDLGAYDEIYECYFNRVLSLCRRMLQHPEDAQEAAQETLLRVYKQLHHLKDDEQLAGWIMRIARNVCLDHIRARSCRPTWTSWGQADEDGGSLPAELAEPEVILLRRHETAYVHHVISSLPQLHQVAILLRDFDELSHAEIADVLDMTPSQVKALVHRARRNFRRSWKSGAVSASL